MGYKWSSASGGDNPHRNVIFRDGKDTADSVAAFTNNESGNPEDLWQWLQAYEEKSGGKALAIPHNGNLSNGRMFALASFQGNPLTRAYAEQRARWEPLEDNFCGKDAPSEPSPTRAQVRKKNVEGWQYSASGLAAVWAQDSTREGIRDARKRRSGRCLTPCGSA